MNADLLRLPESVVDGLLAWCAEAAILAAVLGVIAAFGDRWKRLGPASRHALWLLVLVKLVMPPLVSWPWASTPSPAVMVESEAPPLPVFGDKIEPILPSIDPEPAEIAAVAATAPLRDPEPIPRRDYRVTASGLSRIAVAFWVFGSLVVAARQVWRIGRFGLRTQSVAETPDWLIDDAALVASNLAIRLPEIRVVEGLASPLLWCLGRPVLLVPAGLVASPDPGLWRCILLHEFAHVRRLDPWVSRLELVAGLVWWWNPLYWWACRRIDAEAELACDAWVVAMLPTDRLTYAESLIRICTGRSPARMPAPSVGVAGSGRDFERRLTMILKDRVANRLSTPTLLGALLLLALATPSWTMARPAPAAPPAGPDRVAVAGDASPDDDDDDDEKMEAKKKAEAGKEKAEKDEPKPKPEKKAKKPKKPKKDDPKAVEADLQKAVAEALGPDLEKKVKALAEDLEKKFGPGSDFEKEMKKLGGDMEKKFGPGSDFEKEMKKLGAEIEKKFGPGSDIQEEIGAIGQALKSLQGADGVDIRKEKDEIKQMKARIKAEKAEVQARAEAKPKAESKAKRIKAIEAQIKKLSQGTGEAPGRGGRRRGGRRRQMMSAAPRPSPLEGEGGGSAAG